YQDDKMDNWINNEDAPPHSWSIAEVSFNDMMNGGGNQSILVSGESGAGKTEAVKTVIKYLCKKSVHHLRDEGMKKKAAEIGHKIMESSPILEAFGNAKTINNDNSSRFGKFIKLQFDNNGLVTGAVINNYLLEKSRIIQASPNERVYHIFYQLCAGASDEEKKKFHITKVTDFKSLMSGNCYQVEGMDDVQLYKETRSAMDTVGMTKEEQESI